MIMNKATYVAEDGREFLFSYIGSQQTILVYLNDHPFACIPDVRPEETACTMNNFMIDWNWLESNPRQLHPLLQLKKLVKVN